MTRRNLTPIIMMAGLLAAAPAFAQTQAQKQKTQADGPAMVGPASGAYKQKTQADGPAMVGPASGAYKQSTQSLSHAEPSDNMKQN